MQLHSAPSVAVVGSGYVGTVVAGCLASLGRQVVAVEADRGKCELLSQGKPPFFEPGLDALLASELRSGRLRFTHSVAEGMGASEVVFVCVGTPSGPDGHADMTAMRSAANAIARGLRSPHVLVTKSTVPIGSGHWLTTAIEDAYEGSRPIAELLAVVSCPEFLREGSAIDDFLHPDRVVLGSDDQAAIERVAHVYQPIIEQSFPGGDTATKPAVIRTNLVTAETVKYAANAFLATKISCINEIATICELVGADISGVAEAIGLDPRIGARFLEAGVGWGGSCFGKDLSELISTARDYGQAPPMLEAALEVNQRRRRLVIEKLRAHLQMLRGRRVTLLGLAFKPGTDDLRDAPAVEIARQLVEAGATVVAHDPVVGALPDAPEVLLARDPFEAAWRADAVVLLTDWPEYRDLDFAALRSMMRGPVFIDGRNFLDPSHMRALGFDYEDFGRTAAEPSLRQSQPEPAIQLVTARS